MALSATAAIRLARANVYIVGTRRGGYHVICPYSDIDGPRTEISCRDYWHARQVASETMATIALALIGKPDQYGLAMHRGFRAPWTAVVYDAARAC